MIVAMNALSRKIGRLLFPGIPEIRPRDDQSTRAIFGWVTDSKAIIAGLEG